MVNSITTFLVAAMVASDAAMAFTASSRIHHHLVPSSSSYTSLHATSASSPPTRRDVFARIIGSSAAITAAAVTSISNPNLAYAAGANSPPTPDEIARIQTGYDNIRYLLDHWEQETTVCREAGGKECKRDADPVRKYLGLRSTTDPLFQIEKVFAKVRFMEDLDPDKLEAFFEATEDWNTAMNMSNSMSYISQFAEYNPGGGKDEVLKYLNEAQTQVVVAEKALKVILDCVKSASSSA
ncbi:hypothetical protein ACHAXH_004421 [Discostella pseudostelligera]